MKQDLKSNYDILFIGGIYEKGLENEYLMKSKNGIQNAVNTHQWNFIDGIDLNNKTPVNILSARYVDCYPNYKEIYVKKNVWNHKLDAKDENIGFLNIKILKNIIRKIKLQIKAKKWAKRNSTAEKVIICYYPSIPQMNATIKAKNFKMNIKTVLIIPDIPKFMNLKKEKNKLKHVIQKFIEKKANKLLKKFDSYILLTKEMTNVLNIKEKKYIVIEGIVNPKDSEMELNKLETNNRKNIVYTGSLHEKYGIRNYIEAIKLIKNPDIDFYIFGSGEMENEIKELSKIDTRIKYMGYKDRSIILKYQRNATLLINPRPINEEFAKYSFPSKIVEYMISGTPVLTTRLPSIPEEYFDFLYIINSLSPESIKEVILKYINLSKIELNYKGKVAREFILNNKTIQIQSTKIIELIKRI